MKRLLAALAAAAALAGCVSAQPETPGEANSGYTYVPIDPIPVVVTQGPGCVPTPCSQARLACPLWKSLPDNAARVLVESDGASGSFSYGPQKVGVKNESYKVTFDYINADVMPVPLHIRKTMHLVSDGKVVCPVPLTRPPGPEFQEGSEVYMVSRGPIETPDKEECRSFAHFPDITFTIPVYVGIGLRVSAHVTVLKGTVNLSGLGVLAVEAEANRLRGSLVVQTLGINGKAVTTGLSVQGELNQTTVQNAIVAVGTIKNALHGGELLLTPRAVGFYLPFPGHRSLVNQLVSTLHEKWPEWPQTCPPEPPAAPPAPAS